MRALARLSPRERALVLAALPVALLLAGWVLAWAPLAQARATREAEIGSYRLVAHAAAEAAARAPVAEPDDFIPLAQRVTRSAEAAGLALSRLEPEGEHLRVQVAEAAFPQVVLWLADLEEREGVILAAVEMDRRTAPGAVTATVLFGSAR